jgi:hypothetical protein
MTARFSATAYAGLTAKDHGAVLLHLAYCHDIADVEQGPSRQQKI